MNISFSISIDYDIESSPPGHLLSQLALLQVAIDAMRKTQTETTDEFNH